MLALGMRPEGHRPAFWRKDGVILGVFGDQTEQRPAGNHRQQRCIHQNIDDMLLRRIELIEFLPCLKLTRE